MVLPLTTYKAVIETDRLILTAYREELPVYTELASDIAYLDIEVLSTPLMVEEPTGDLEGTAS